MRMAGLLRLGNCLMAFFGVLIGAIVEFDIDRVLGLNLKETAVMDKIPQEIKLLARQREEFRKNKDFTNADKIRDELSKNGYIIEDTPAGPKVKKEN